MFQNIGPLLYPLLFCSILAVIFIVERVMYFIRLEPLAKCNILKKLESELEQNKKIKKEVRDELISERLSEVKEQFEYGIRFLRMIAMISPMLGLLGTVIGIIESFKTIATIKGAVSPAAIADGLWNAMLTTAYGLSIAIASMFAAFIFARISEKRLNKYETVLNRSSLEIEGVKFND